MKNGKEKQYHLPYDSKPVQVRKRGSGTENLGKKIKILKMGAGKNIKLYGALYIHTMQAKLSAQSQQSNKADTSTSPVQDPSHKVRLQN